MEKVVKFIAKLALFMLFMVVSPLIVVAATAGLSRNAWKRLGTAPAGPEDGRTEGTEVKETERKEAAVREGLKEGLPHEAETVIKETGITETNETEAKEMETNEGLTPFGEEGLLRQADEAETARMTEAEVNETELTEAETEEAVMKEAEAPEEVLSAPQEDLGQDSERSSAEENLSEMAEAFRRGEHGDVPDIGDGEGTAEERRMRRFAEDAARIRSVDMTVDKEEKVLVITSTVMDEESAFTKTEKRKLTDGELASLLDRGMTLSPAQRMDLLMQIHPDCFSSYSLPDGSPLYPNALSDYINDGKVWRPGRAAVPEKDMKETMNETVKEAVKEKEAVKRAAGIGNEVKCGRDGTRPAEKKPVRGMTIS